MQITPYPAIFSSWPSHRALMESKPTSSSDTFTKQAAPGGNVQFSGLLPKSKNEKLLEAAKIGNTKAVEALLIKGAKIDYQDKNKRTALMIAAENDQINTVRFLVANKANVNLTDKQQRTARMLAKQADIEAILNGVPTRPRPTTDSLNTGSNSENKSPSVTLPKEAPESRIDKVFNPFGAVSNSESGNSVYESLLENGSQESMVPAGNLNAESSTAWVKDKEQRIREYLNSESSGSTDKDSLLESLRPGESAEKPQSASEYNVSHLPESSDLQAPSLKKKGSERSISQASEKSGVSEATNTSVNMNDPLRNGLTPLTSACQKGDKGLVRHLLMQGVDVNKADAYGSPPLLVAVVANHPPIAELLLNKGANPNQANNINHEQKCNCPICMRSNVSPSVTPGDTPLIQAALAKNAPLVELLLLRGANPGLRNCHDKTALDYLTCHKTKDEIDKEIINKLKDALNLGYQLPHAIAQGNVNRVEKLILNKADVNQLDESNSSPLYNAVKVQDPTARLKIAKLLIDHHADKDKFDNMLYSPLTLAVVENKANLIHLLASPKTINARNKEGETPLMTACSKGFKSVVEQLLEEGANPGLQDKYGMTALDLAKMNIKDEPLKQSIVSLVQNKASIEQAAFIPLI